MLKTCCIMLLGMSSPFVLCLGEGSSGIRYVHISLRFEELSQISPYSSLCDLWNSLSLFFFLTVCPFLSLQAETWASPAERNRCWTGEFLLFSLVRLCPNSTTGFQLSGNNCWKCFFLQNASYFFKFSFFHPDHLPPPGTSITQPSLEIAKLKWTRNIQPPAALRHNMMSYVISIHALSIYISCV